jgi:hypothetical protein
VLQSALGAGYNRVLSGVLDQNINVYTRWGPVVYGFNGGAFGRQKRRLIMFLLIILVLVPYTIAMSSAMPLFLPQ